MRNLLKFYISFLIFITAYICIEHFRVTIGAFQVLNIKVILLFIYAIFMWTAQVLPNSLISILIIALIAVLKYDTFTNVVSYSFGNTIFIFVLAILVISYSFAKSGISERISRGLSGWFGGNDRHMLFGFMLATYVLAMFLTAIGGVTIVFPIALNLIEKNRLEKGNKFAKAFMLGVAYSGLIGGVATPLGTPVNIIMIQYLKDLGGYDLTFLHWALIGIPLSFMILLCGFYLLVWLLKIKGSTIERDNTEMGPLSGKEKRSMAAYALIIILFLSAQFWESRIQWVSINLNTISVICCLIVVLPPFRLVEWKDALKKLDWESIVFLAGSVALGYLLYNTKTATLIASEIFRIVGRQNLYLYVFIFCAFTILMHLILSSNTVTGTVIIPILISFAQQMDVSPWYVAAPAVFSISLAFILPIESPTNIITFSTGYYELKDMVKTGTILTVFSIGIISVFLILFGIATGLYRIG